MTDRLQKELYVLAMTYNGLTQREIAEQMGITISRVQQIKRKALMRAKIMRRNYEEK